MQYYNVYAVLKGVCSTGDKDFSMKCMHKIIMSWLFLNYCMFFKFLLAVSHDTMEAPPVTMMPVTGGTINMMEYLLQGESCARFGLTGLSESYHM